MFALKHVGAILEITKTTCFDDFGLIIEIWKNFGLDFKRNFDPDPLEIVPDPKTANIYRKTPDKPLQRQVCYGAQNSLTLHQ